MNILPYVPVGPMLVDVLGLDGAKAGRLPTDDEHARLAAMLDEAMEAGGCGWSAQRLPPTGPAAVQRDWDGTPMPTDVMHDETCRVLARVLARRNTGVQQLTLTTDDIRHDLAHLEEIATLSGRPVLHNVVQAFESRAARAPPGDRVARAVPGARHPRVRPGRDDRRRVHVHVRGLEPLRRLRGVDGGDDRHRWGSGWPSWPTRTGARA